MEGVWRQRFAQWLCCAVAACVGSYGSGPGRLQLTHLCAFGHAAGAGADLRGQWRVAWQNVAFAHVLRQRWPMRWPEG